MQTSVDVETAIKQALERPLEAAAVAAPPGSALGAETVAAALTAAIRDANAPLLEELRGVRASLERLEAGLQTLHLTEPTGTAETPSAERREHGPLVRFARWLKRRLRR